MGRPLPQILGAVPLSLRPWVSCGRMWTEGRGSKTRFSCGRHKWMTPRLHAHCGLKVEEYGIAVIELLEWTVVIVNFRFLQCLRKRSRGNQLTHKLTD